MVDFVSHRVKDIIDQLGDLRCSLFRDSDFLGGLIRDIHGANDLIVFYSDWFLAVTGEGLLRCACVCDHVDFLTSGCRVFDNLKLSVHVN